MMNQELLQISSKSSPLMPLAKPLFFRSPFNEMPNLNMFPFPGHLIPNFSPFEPLYPYHPILAQDTLGAKLLSPLLPREPTSFQICPKTGPITENRVLNSSNRDLREVKSQILQTSKTLNHLQRNLQFNRVSPQSSFEPQTMTSHFPLRY